MAFSNAVKYMVDVDAKGAVTGIKAAADAADGGAGKFKAFDTVLQGVQLGMGLDIWGTFKNVLQNAVAALPALISKTGEYAGALLKTEASLRLSAEAQQVLMRAGNDVGISWENQTTAIRKMQNVLAATPQQVKNLGLSWDDLKALAPEKQYEAIGKAVAAIEDPIERTQAATDFFGKSGTEVLGLFGGAIDQAREDSEKFALTMDTTTAQSVDRLSDNIELGGEALEGMGRSFVGAIASSEPLQTAVEGILDVIGYLSREIAANKGEISLWVSTGIIAALNALMMLTPAIGWAIDSFTGLQIGVAGAVKMFKDAAAVAVFMATSFTSPIQAAKQLAATLKKNAEDFEQSTAAAMKTNAEWQAKLATGTNALSTFTDKVEAAAGSTARNTEATRKGLGAYDDSAKAIAAAKKEQEANTKALAEAEKQWADLYRTVHTMQGKDLMFFTEETRKKNAEILKAIEKDVIDSLERMNDEEREQVRIGAEASAQVTQNWKDFGKSVEEVLKKQQEALEAQLDSWSDWGAAIGAVGDLFETLGISGARTLKELSTAVGIGVKAWEQYKTGASNAQKAVTVAQGAQTAYNSSLLGGAAAGAAAGAAFGPLGIAIGAVGGALLGWIGTNKRAQEEARKLREEIDNGRRTFIEAQGGFEALIARATAAGYTLDRLFLARTVQEYNAAVKELTDAFALQEKAGQALDAAMQKYGITIDQLGPKFSQQKLDQQAMDLLRDYELLSAAGVDHVLILEKMGPEFSKYVQTAMAAGATLPESLRPMILKMIELGLLTDEAGNKIDSIDKIKFAPTMSEAIVSMTKAIQDLVAALLGIPNIHRTVTIETNHTTGGGGGGTPSNPGDPGDPGGPPEMAFGGIVAPRPGGTLARVAEAGQAELVAPVRAFSRTLAADLARAVGGNSGASGAVHIYLDRQTGEARQLTPAEARRIGAGLRAGLIQVPVRTLTARTQ